MRCPHVHSDAGTPAAIVDRLNGEIGKALADPAVRQKFLEADQEPVGGSRAQFARAIVVTRRIPRADDLPRVDAVPAGLLALLLDLGIDPGRIGADRLHEARVSAWETAAPSAAKAPLTAHVERPALELALLDRLVATGGVPIVRGPCGLPAQGDGWRARMVVDATGRRALTAARRQRPARPWVARTFWTPLQSCGAEPGFAIAALPDGYAYRLGSRSIACLGVVGRLAIAAQCSGAAPPSD